MISRIIDYNKSRFIQDKDNEYQNIQSISKKFKWNLDNFNYDEYPKDIYITKSI